MSRTVIIDGDIVIYRAAEVAIENFETEFEEEDETYLYQKVIYGDKKRAISVVNMMIEGICRETHSDKVIICLTNGQNFRKTINPNYKRNRKKAVKPLLFKFLREYFVKAGFDVYERPYLEADDCIGILATNKTNIKGDRCIWSFDKDFKTIPCNFAKGYPGGRVEKYIISEAEANWWFMYQTLIGDATDGYKGCYKIGDKTARKLLGEPGEKTLPEMWEIVKQTYIKQGQSEDEALLNARMARILRNEDYDFKKREVKLWNP